MGRDEEAIRLAERVAELDPNNPDLSFRVAHVYAMAQDYDRAISAYHDSIRLDPAFVFSIFSLGSLEATRGNLTEAGRLMQIAEELLGPVQSGFILGYLAYGYGLAERPEKARQVFDRISQLAENRRVGAISWAMAYLGIGDQEQALASLNAVANDHAPDEGSYFRGTLKRNVYGDPILDQPEFVEVRSRLGFRE